MTATFSIQTFTITVTAITGDGNVADGTAGDIDCDDSSLTGTCSDTYDAGTTVTLTATPDTGWRFGSWGGDCSSETTDTCTITDIQAAKSVSVTFIEVHDVVVTVVGTGGTVTDGAEGALSCTSASSPCTETYDATTNVTLTAAPDTGYQFDGWTGTDAGDCSGTTCTFSSLASAKAVTATFTSGATPPTMGLTVTTTGNGKGTVTSNPRGISCGRGCFKSFPTGTVVTLRANPKLYHSFVGWSGAGCVGTGRCVVTMSQAWTVVAQFSRGSATVTLTAGARVALAFLSRS